MGPVTGPTWWKPLPVGGRGGRERYRVTRAGCALPGERTPPQGCLGQIQNQKTEWRGRGFPRPLGVFKRDCFHCPVPSTPPDTFFPSIISLSAMSAFSPSARPLTCRAGCDVKVAAPGKQHPAAWCFSLGLFLVTTLKNVMTTVAWEMWKR